MTHERKKGELYRSKLYRGDQWLRATFNLAHENLVYLATGDRFECQKLSQLHCICTGACSLLFALFLYLCNPRYCIC